MAIDLASNQRQRIDVRGVRKGYLLAGLRPQGLPGGFGKTGLIRRQQIAVDHVEHRRQAPLTHAQLQAAARVEAFGAADRRVAAQINHELVAGIDAQPSQAIRGEGRTRNVQRRNGIGHADAFR